MLENIAALSREKLESAMSDALKKIDKMMEKHSDGSFPGASSVDGVYAKIENKGGWTQCFYTGMLWLAYEYTKDEKYKNEARKLCDTFINRVDNMIGMGDHDIGFNFTLSTVAGFKATGDNVLRQKSIEAAQVLANRFRERGQFIQLAGDTNVEDPKLYRLIIDCLMNINLLHWAGKETGDSEFSRKAVAHFNTTMNTVVREDGSTYQNFYFDPDTGERIGGGTKQGKDADSCWSRGQAWGVTGIPFTYSYLQNTDIMDKYYRITDYYLNHLPEDFVAYWDLCFMDGDEPRDSSAASIAVCGLLEALKSMPLDAPHKIRYSEAVGNILGSLMENYTTKDCADEGLLKAGTYYYAGNLGINECCIWGDYFYMEALMRLLNPDWKKYW